MVLENELDAYACILLMHFRAMIGSLRKVPADKWDWTYAPPAPTPRILAIHAVQWLQCDRQHLQNPDAKTHRPVKDVPTDAVGICAAMEHEADEWELLLKSFTAEALDRVSYQFGLENATLNGRGFICHMLQNVIYKHGQFSTIFFALGLDGHEPYDAPFPNKLYKELCGID